MLHDNDRKKAERHVLYGAVNEVSFLEEALAFGVMPVFFKDMIHKMFFATVVNYYTTFKCLLTREVLERKLRIENASEEDITNHLITYDTIQQSKTDKENFTYYLHELKREYDEESLRKILKKSGDSLMSKEDIYVIREKLINEVNSMSVSEEEAKIELVDLKGSADRVREELNDRRDNPEKFWGAQCEIPDIDKPIQGFVPGRMLIIAAEPGGFKSTMAINIGYRLANYAKEETLFISMEMRHMDIMFKMIALDGRLSTGKLFSGDIGKIDGKIDKVLDKWREMDNGKLKILDVAQMGKTPVGRILSEIHKAHSYFKPKVVIVDYLSLIGPDTPNPRRPDLELGDICKALRGAARRYGFSLVVLCQIKRGAIERMRKQSDKSGNVSLGGEDLGGSQEIANDADAIYFLVYDTKTEDKLNVVIGKNRWGPRGDFELVINKDQSLVDGNENAKSIEEKRADIKNPESRGNILDFLDTDDDFLSKKAVEGVTGSKEEKEVEKEPETAPAPEPESSPEEGSNDEWSQEDILNDVLNG